MSAPSITHKRGDTFRITSQIKDSAGVNINLTGYTIASQLRQADGTKIQDLSCTAINLSAGLIAVSATAAQSALWPITALFFDIQLTDSNGFVRSSDTISIKVIKDITYND